MSLQRQELICNGSSVDGQVHVRGERTPNLTHWVDSGRVTPNYFLPASGDKHEAARVLRLQLRLQTDKITACNPGIQSPRGCVVQHVVCSESDRSTRDIKGWDARRWGCCCYGGGSSCSDSLTPSPRHSGSTPGPSCVSPPTPPSYLSKHVLQPDRLLSILVLWHQSLVVGFTFLGFLSLKHFYWFLFRCHYLAGSLMLSGLYNVMALVGTRRSAPLHFDPSFIK